VSKTTVAWALITVPSGSLGLAMMVYETKPSPAPSALSGGRKPIVGSVGISPVLGSIVVNVQVATPVSSSIVAATWTS